jgi:Mg2+ and Co2+ transporter CorA
MPANTSAAHRLGMDTHPAARLVSVSGASDLATPGDVERQAAAGGFFWLDLESLDRDLLGQFGRSLRLGTSAIAELEDSGQPAGMARGAARARQRPSLTAAGDVIQALVFAAGGLAADAAPIPVRIVYTAQFLLTVHSAPCPALAQARHRYDGLRDEVKADGPLVLFLVLDELAGSFQEQFLTLDARLDEIQVQLLTTSSRGSQTEVLAIRRRLADAVQSLGWYTGDLDDLIAAGVAQLPGLGPGAQGHLDRHRQRVVRLTDAAREYREEARETLGQYSQNISDRQGQVINFLAVISAIFLPLTFITGYFGMNFDVLTVDLKSIWLYILLGNLLPALSVVVVYVLFRRWVTNLGIPRILPTRRRAGKPPTEPETAAAGHPTQSP